MVKGEIPSDSIVIGNPCRIIAKTSEWTRKQLELKEFLIEDEL